jgi:hypothetical protein
MVNIDIGLRLLINNKPECSCRKGKKMKTSPSLLSFCVKRKIKQCLRLMLCISIRLETLNLVSTILPDGEGAIVGEVEIATF